jgi:hypothetical protein
MPKFADRRVGCAPRTMTSFEINDDFGFQRLLPSSPLIANYPVEAYGYTPLHNLATSLTANQKDCFLRSL